MAALTEYQATVTSRGQLTLPLAVRQEMDVRPGDRVVFSRGPDGSYLLRRVVRAHAVAVDSLRGRWRSNPPRRTDDILTELRGRRPDEPLP